MEFRLVMLLQLFSFIKVRPSGATVHTILFCRHWDFAREKLCNKSKKKCPTKIRSETVWLVIAGSTLTVIFLGYVST
jgi:hypothetical protein